MLLRNILEEIPIVADFYRYHWVFTRRPNAYRGVYNSFDEALKAVPQGKSGGYSQPEINQSSSASRLTSSYEIGDFNSLDYPVIFWLKSLFNDSNSVFDLGGNVGLAYYAYQNYLQYPDNLSWLVCEIPEIVKAGTEIAIKKNINNLHFTSEYSQADGYDILLTCGALQYIEPNLPQLIKSFNEKPKHILTNHVPFCDNKSYITLQNLIYTFCPYKIQNKNEFICDLNNLGYELIDTWEIERNCIIPFHAEHFVSAYYGFYFRLKNH